MPGKVMKLITKALHADGYYIAVVRQEEEQPSAAKAKEEIPTPGFALIKEEVGNLDSSSSDYSSSSSFQSKLDATKRKMHDSYLQLANNKKQRKIQVIDPRDLPPTQSSSKGRNVVLALAARKTKKMITTSNKKTIARSTDFFNGGGRPKLVKPTSIF